VAIPLAARGSRPLVAMTRGLTAVDGIKVGHHTLTGRPTGCTVIVTEKGAVAGVDVRGYGLWTPTLLALVSTAAAFVAVHIVRRAGAGQPNS
jgi:hypothetical protein